MRNLAASLGGGDASASSLNQSFLPATQYVEFVANISDPSRLSSLIAVETGPAEIQPSPKPDVFRWSSFEPSHLLLSSIGRSYLSFVTSFADRLA